MTRLLSTLVLVTSVVFAAACSDSGIKKMSAQEFAPLFDSAVTIDVRTQEEYDQGHLAQTVHIDVRKRNFGDLVSALDRDKAYYLYCRSGNRSQQAAAKMIDLGFTNVTNIGGFAELEAAGVPVLR